MRRFFARIGAFFRRLFRRAVAPGRFETGSAGSWHGWIASAPIVLPRRDYLVYLPAGHTRWRRAPLLVLCHGCKQTPEDIAAATRIAAFADEHGWMVLLPRQKPNANAWSCWNWFDGRTAHGMGEAAILLAQIKDVLDGHRGDRARVVVAGMSAGGALAAAAALHHAVDIRGAFIHSGVACGAASGPAQAFDVMRRGPDADVETMARRARSQWTRPLALPVCVVHGEADDVVAPVNGIALVRQFLRLNDHPALARPLPPGTQESATLPPADAEMREALPGERVVTTREWRNGPALVVRHVSIAGLAHAWSGGDPAYPFNDPAPPPATVALARFALDVVGLP